MVGIVSDQYVTYICGVFRFSLNKNKNLRKYLKY